MASGLRTAFTAITALSLALGFAAVAARAAEGDGLHAVPSVYWQSGDHRLDLGADFRYRAEFWNAWNGAKAEWSTFSGLRTRVRAKYAFRDLVSVFGEFQDARIHGLSHKSSGAGALYRRFSSGGDADLITSIRIGSQVPPPLLLALPAFSVIGVSPII